CDAEAADHARRRRRHRQGGRRAVARLPRRPHAAGARARDPVRGHGADPREALRKPAVLRRQPDRDGCQNSVERSASRAGDRSEPAARRDHRLARHPRRDGPDRRGARGPGPLGHPQRPAGRPRIRADRFALESPGRPHHPRVTVCAAALVGIIAFAAGARPAAADETCNSPYMGNLIKGQEDYLYVWALGIKGMGDGSDKLVTIDVNPSSSRYGKVINKVSVRGQGEAHHMGFTDDRRFLWAGGLDSSRITIFDIGTDPSRPKLVRTISDMPAKTGYVGPHTFYAMPGRMIVQGLSNKDGGGVTGMAIYSNKGELVSTHAMPTTDGGDGYGYDVAINPQKNVMLTSSFTGRKNYMRPLGELVKDGEAMKRFGNTMVVWDLKAMKPKKVLSVPGAPLEIRWSPKDGDNWAITATALTSKLWLIKPDAAGEWQAKEVGTIDDPTKIPLPVDISIN